VRRDDGVYLDALGAQRIPDPTTAGDYGRRFREGEVDPWTAIFNKTRLRPWKQPIDVFFDESIIDADGTLPPRTTGAIAVEGDDGQVLGLLESVGGDLSGQSTIGVIPGPLQNDTVAFWLGLFGPLRRVR